MKRIEELANIDSNQKRLDWLDREKGVAIILVVIGHSLSVPIRASGSSYNLLFSLIYFFHMPFFFFVSGAAFSLNLDRHIQQNPLLFIKRKAKSLLLPFLSYSVLVYAFFFGISKIGRFSSVLNNAGYGPISLRVFLSQLLIGTNKYAVHMWYLYTLFMLSIVIFFIVKITKKTSFYLCIILLLGAQIYFTYISDILPTAFAALCAFGLWFVIGMKYKQFHINKFISIIFILGGITFYILEYFSIISSSHVIGLALIEIAVKTLLVIGLFSFIQKEEKGSRLTTYLGRRSMDIYIFHQPLLGTCVGYLLVNYLSFPKLATMVLSIALSITLPLLLCHVIRKFTWSRLLFGLKGGGDRHESIL